MQSELGDGLSVTVTLGEAGHVFVFQVSPSDRNLMRLVGDPQWAGGTEPPLASPLLNEAFHLASDWLARQAPAMPP